MLLQLHHAGILNRQQAIVLGSFSGAAANDYDAGYVLLTMIDYIRSRIRVPVITGLDFGHEQQTVTLPLGAQAVLVNDEKGSHLTLSGHPVIKA
jgi:muramoyltetrapeptide carboxypeptidase